MRLVVLGPGAARKSNFARRLGEITGTPVVELDSVFWSDDLAPTTPEDWASIQAELVADDAWILDGDLGPHDVLRPRLERADTVVMFDPPRVKCVWRALRRSREKWEFWVWLLTWRRRERPRLQAAIEQYAPEARSVIVTSDMQVERLAMVPEFDARTVLDVGCGTGTLACLLAERGVDVIGVDPAGASLDVARTKTGAGGVRWIHGDAATAVSKLDEGSIDLAVMTGNVAQVFVTDDGWLATLTALSTLVRPGGRLVFETRDPAKRAWEEWTKVQTWTRTDVGRRRCGGALGAGHRRVDAARHLRVSSSLRRDRRDDHVDVDAAVSHSRPTRRIARRG